MLLGIKGDDRMEEVLKFEMTFLEKLKFMSHFISKIFLYVIFVLLLLVFFIFGIYFLDTVHNIRTSSTKTPLFSAYVIVSPSMVPTIKVQDGVIIKRDNNLEIGDIITFSSRDPRYTGLTITHRIVGIEKTEKGEVLYRTKGDNNNVSDRSLVHKDDVIGKVLFKFPKAGYIKNYLFNGSNLIFLLIILSILVVLYDSIKIIKNSKNKNRIRYVEVDDDII